MGYIVKRQDGSEAYFEKEADAEGYARDVSGVMRPHDPFTGNAPTVPETGPENPEHDQTGY